MNTLENNKLLAEFLGLEAQDDGTYFDPEVNEFISLEDLDFSSSWDMLVQVVEKIESLGFSVTINTDTCSVAYDTIEIFTFIRDYKISKLKVAYNACIQFVKWYNNN